ncbi:MAG: hypothetical protein R3C44_01760 [Chloroflexota bacterium]
MTTDKEPLKITLEDLDPETPQPSSSRSKLQEQAGATGRQVAGTAKDIAGKFTDKLAATAADATNRTAEAAREKMTEAFQEQSKAIADAVEQRVREIDWKAEAQKGTEGGLRWLSERLNEIADRMKAAPNNSDDANISEKSPKDDK